MERFTKLFEKNTLTLEELEELRELDCVDCIYYNGLSKTFKGKHFYTLYVEGEEFYVYTDERA